MCNISCIAFVEKVLKEQEVKGKRVLEIGSFNVNGSVRSPIERLGPAEYLGVDIAAGPGVDRVCPAEDLPACFAPGTFGLVVSTEMLEHVLDWRRVLSNMKGLLEPGGVLILTTRSKGFYYHGYPNDYWRYEAQDMRELFSDLQILELESDPTDPGIFLKAVKQEPFAEKDLKGYALYSMVKRKRAAAITGFDEFLFRFTYYFPRKILLYFVPEPVKRILREIF